MLRIMKTLNMTTKQNSSADRADCDKALAQARQWTLRGGCFVHSSFQGQD